MVSLFPQLLTYQEVSPFLIRLVVAGVFIYWSYAALRNNLATTQQKGIAAVEGLAAVLVLLGLWLQLAAAILGIDLILKIAAKIKNKQFLTNGVNYYLILLVLCLSLLVTGAGWFAFDLKL